MKVYEFKADGKAVTLKGKRELDKFYIGRLFIYDGFAIDGETVKITDTRTGKIEYKTLWKAVQSAGEK